MGSMTRLQMRDEVFRQFGESAGYVTEDDVDAWLADAYVRFANEAECLIGYVPIDITDGIGILPPCLREILTVDSGTTSILSEYDWNPKYIIMRPWNKAYSQINIKYLGVPSRASNAIFKQMTANDSKTQLTEEGDSALIQLALARSYRKDQRHDEADIAMTEYKTLASQEYWRLSDIRKRNVIRTDAFTGSTTTQSGINLTNSSTV